MDAETTAPALPNPGPLAGLKVLELGQLIAGPFAGKTLADIVADPHFTARGMLQRITLPDGLALDVPGMVPKLCATPGALGALAPGLGEHTEAVLRDGWQNINRQN